MSEDWWDSKVRITCEEKHGVCEHDVGDTFVFEHVQDYADGLCSGIQDLARLYTAYCAIGSSPENPAMIASTGSIASPRRARSGGSRGSKKINRVSVSDFFKYGFFHLP